MRAPLIAPTIVSLLGLLATQPLLNPNTAYALDNTHKQSASTTPYETHGKATYKPLAYKVLKVQAHNPKAFTQGWIISGNNFYESSGLYGRSYVARYNRSNQQQQRYPLPANQFAEGLTQVNNELYVLTWKAGIGHILNADTLTLKRHFNYKGQGWGLTHNAHTFFMSDGTHTLQLRDKKTFTKTQTLTVRGGPYYWGNLNELEYLNGIIWANIWQSPLIVAIDATSGLVRGVLNLQRLVNTNTQRPMHESLNGIAYDAQHKAFWVTGKHWPNRYLIDIHLETLNQTPK